jgi:HlyD family secretion protein
MLEQGATEEEIETARAQAAIARQQLKLGRHGASKTELEQLDATIEATRAKLELAQRSADRVRELTKAGVGTPAQLDQANAELESLRAELKRLKAQRDQARSGARSEERAILQEQLVQAKARLKHVEKGARTEELAMASAAVDAARAEYEIANTNVGHCEVRAGAPGRIDVVNFAVGELVSPGLPIASIIDLSTFEFRAFARQEQLGAIKVDDAVKVTIDGFPSASLDAKVIRIYDTPEFTAGNVQTSDDRMLLVFRVDLELQPRPEVPLRPGMTGVVDFPDAGGTQ